MWSYDHVCASFGVPRRKDLCYPLSKDVLDVLRIISVNDDFEGWNWMEWHANVGRWNFKMWGCISCMIWWGSWADDNLIIFQLMQKKNSIVTMYQLSIMWCTHACMPTMMSINHQISRSSSSSTNFLVQVYGLAKFVYAQGYVANLYARPY